MTRKAWILGLIILFLGFWVWLAHLKLLYPPYLTFSDAAKFADSAQEMIKGNGFTTRFGFFHPEFVFSPESREMIVPGFGVLNALT